MQSIPIKLFFSSINKTSSFSIPLLSKGEIENRINIFVQTRPIMKRPHVGLERQRVLVKDLFQRKNKEFFILPYTQCSFLENPNIQKNLTLLHKSHSDGIVLCFVPTDDTFRICPLNKEIWIRENPSENLKEAEFFSLSKDVVSVFCFEDGWISQCSDGQFVLRGIEIMILQTSIMQSLLFKKVEIESSAPERPLHQHPLSPLSNNSKFVKLPCFFRCKDFSFQMTFPVLTNSELKIELKNSYQEEWKLFSYFSEYNFFNTEETRHQAICFPNGMEIKFPFFGVKGWKLFFVLTEKVNNFLCIFIPKISNRSILTTRKNYIPFCEWQTGKLQYLQTMLDQVRPYCFNISQMSLIRKNTLEYCVKGGDVKVVSKEATGLWGLFFSRQQKDETCFSEKKEAVSTAIISSLLSPARDSIEPREKSSRKRLYPFQTSLVERPPSQPKNTSLLQPSPSLFPIIKTSPLTPLQPLVASMVQLPGNVVRLEPLQLPPLPFSEPARRLKQQEDVFTKAEKKNKKLKIQFSFPSSSILKDHAPVSSLEEMIALIDKSEEEQKKQSQKKFSEDDPPVKALEEMIAFMYEVEEKKSS